MVGFAVVIPALVAALVALPPIVAPVLVLLVACGGQVDSPQTPAACGWDLTSQAGRDANAERLDFINQWLINNPGVPAPEPTSTYWHGECPTPTAPKTLPDRRHASRSLRHGPVVLAVGQSAASVS